MTTNRVRFKFTLRYSKQHIDISHNSLDFVANRFMMKLFNTNNMQIIVFCCEQFNFILPSRQIVTDVLNLLNLTANAPTC